MVHSEAASNCLVEWKKSVKFQTVEQVGLAVLGSRPIAGHVDAILELLEAV